MGPPRSEKRGAQAGPACITLTSDFGLRDPYVGVMKRRIFERLPAAALIDLTHEITPFRPEEAGYWLSCVHPWFPPGAVHVAVVDPGVGGERTIAVLDAFGQQFVAPDNGLLGLIAAGDAGARAYRVMPEALARLGLGFQSATFHGRDVMAPLGAELAAGRCGAEQVGSPCRLRPGSLAPARLEEPGRIRGQIAVIDHFGNALTTIALAAIEAAFPDHAATGLEAELDGRRYRLAHTYADAERGECVALINSWSMLELACREGSAAQELNIRADQPVSVHTAPAVPAATGAVSARASTR